MSVPKKLQEGTLSGGIRIHLKCGDNEIRIAVEAVVEAHIHVFLIR